MAHKEEGRTSAPTGDRPPGFAGDLPDIFTRAMRFETDGRIGNRFRTFRTSVNGVVGFELVLRDQSGGLNALDGDFDVIGSRSRASSLDTRYPRYLTLPPLLTTQAAPDPGGTITGLHHANIFSTCIIGMGASAFSDGVSASLFKETSATNPTLVGIDYTATSSITCLQPVNLGSATVAKMLLVGRLSDPAQLLSDATGTVNATLHTDVEPLWGAIPTFLPELPILLYANGAIRILNGSAAATTQPTVTLSSVPNGGYALGLLPFGGPWRAYWVWPTANNASGLLNTEGSGVIVHTTQEGTDPYPLMLPMLRFVRYAAIVPGRQALVASDDEIIVVHDGQTIRNTYWASEREPDSDIQQEIRGFFVKDSDVYVMGTRRKSDFTSASPNTTIFIEQLDWRTMTWHRVSAEVTLSVGGRVGPIAGSLPVSSGSGFSHYHVDGAWYRQWQPFPGGEFLTPFHARQTAGAAAASGKAAAASGTWTSPYWNFPDFNGYPKEVTEIVFGGRIENVGSPTTAGKVVVTAGGRTATFGTGFTDEHQVSTFPGIGDLWDTLQMTVAATQQSGGTDPTRANINAFPITIRGLIYADTVKVNQWRKRTRGI
ncbi:MAG: hypothetical protein U0990_11905 [Candidatus Nanopelagicales bacterium]|nr:hypothetical protein [Candidatus Nanopelagicales bacterium]